MPSLLSKIQGSLVGVAIGDAMGMPWEIYSAEKITELTNGKGIDGFTSPVFRRVKDTEKLEIGSTTDDWQLTEAVAKSLIKEKGFDLISQALFHVDAFETSVSGWGGTTRKGLAELKEFFDSRGKSGRHPLDKATGIDGKGLGNGVAMKIAPLAHASVLVRLFDHTVWGLTQQLGGLTHPDVRASAAAMGVALIIREAMFDRSPDVALSNAISFLTMNEPYQSDAFALRLTKLKNTELLYGNIETLIKEIGTDCMALESVTFAIAVALRNHNNFRNGIIEAVNAGGDTDTIAAMAGSMIGAWVGIEGIPEEWIKFNPDFQKAIDLGTQLYETLK